MDFVDEYLAYVLEHDGQAEYDRIVNFFNKHRQALNQMAEDIVKEIKLLTK
ncbi:hypothetical protein [Eremococcus coleocola]|uniref:hypothetical protein n=1 Tax=Eremococcus coleocola TaxID=88132 RepID=UPI000429A7A6|nr:hypothetical protein [Eremococcus coleocola]